MKLEVELLQTAAAMYCRDRSTRSGRLLLEDRHERTFGFDAHERATIKPRLGLFEALFSTVASERQFGLTLHNDAMNC